MAVVQSPWRGTAGRVSRKAGVATFAGVLVVTAIGLALLKLWGGDGEPSAGAGDVVAGDLLPSLTGTASLEIEPKSGTLLRAGLASVEVRPFAISEKATLTATLNADRTLNITMQPAFSLAVPALVTLPLPPRAETGDDGSKWPVALLESPGQDPLVLEPEAVGESTFSVLVPHFSTVTPLQSGDALKRAGSAVPAGPSHAPAVIDAKVTLAENTDPNAQVTQVLLTVSAKARTSENGGVPKEEGGQLAPGWERFKRLKVRVFESKEQLQIGFLAIGEGDIVNGRPVVLSVSTRMLDQPQNAAYIRLEDENGNLLVVRSIALPNGKYWKDMKCTEAGNHADFVVHYMWDTRNAAHPDANYAGQAIAKFPIPGRAFDACAALTDAYNLFNSPRWFNDRDHAPSLPMDVWLQPWQENQAGNVRNYISLRTSAGDFDEFKRDAAHEMAHRFQHQYSTGYTGGWFHDASAEYLANRIYGPDEVLAPFVGLVPDWIGGGLMTATDVDAYSASSFLAYLSSMYGFNIARLWVDGASGLANAQSWQTYLDSLLRPQTNGVGLTKAWDDFARLYLIDRSGWGDWTGVNLAPLFSRDIITLGSSKPYYQQILKPAPYLSGGGSYITFSGAPSATIVYRISETNSNRFERYAKYWVSPGDVIDGRVEAVTLEGSRPLQKVGSFRIGKTPGAINDKGLARISYAFSDWQGNSPKSTQLTIEAWALPEAVGVEVTDTGDIYSWPPSPIEKLSDSQKQPLFDEYEVVGRDRDQPNKWVVLDGVTPGKDKYEVVISDELLQSKHGAEPVCVRVKDRLGNTGPEGCPAAATKSWKITTAAYSESGVFREPMVVRGLLGLTRKAGNQPEVCRIDIQEWKDGTDIGLACVFVPGCSADDDCFSLILATADPSLTGALSITATEIKGDICTSPSAGGCFMRLWIDATVSPGKLTGTFGYWSKYYADNSEATATFKFEAVPAR